VLSRRAGRTRSPPIVAGGVRFSFVAEINSAIGVPILLEARIIPYLSAIKPVNTEPGSVVAVRLRRDIGGMNEKKLFTAFGKRIQELRKRKGWSQDRLAEAIGRTRDAVSNMERGVNGTHIKIAYAIAEALDVPLADLLEFGPAHAADRERRAQINKLIALVADRDPATLEKIHTLVSVALDVNAPRPAGRKKAG
jgi:transcriptional regulator with XRE-family HTH domain